MYQQVRDVDTVVDTAGGDALSQSWRVLRPGGILVSIASAPSDADARRYHAKGLYFIAQPDASELAKLAQLADSGRLRTAVGRVFPLTDAAAAFDALEHQHVRGKVVLRVRPEPAWTSST